MGKAGCRLHTHTDYSYRYRKVKDINRRKEETNYFSWKVYLDDIAMVR